MGDFYSSRKIKGWCGNSDYYYIHLLKDDIGKMYDDTTVSGSGIADLYSNYRKIKKHNQVSQIAQTLKTQYIQLLGNSFKGNNMGKLSSLASKIKQEGVTKYNEDLAQKISDILEEELNKVFSVEEVYKLIDIENKINAASISKKTINSAEMQKNFYWFNELLDIISEAVVLLGGKSNPQELANNSYYKGFYNALKTFNPQACTDLVQLGTDFGTMLDSYTDIKIKDKSGKSVTADSLPAKQIMNLASNLQILAEKMKTINITEKTKLAESFKIIIDKQCFAQGLGESFIGTMVSQAVKNVDIELENLVIKENHIHFDGGEKKGISISNEMGEYQNSIVDKTSGKQQKTDVNMQNCKIIVQDMNGKNLKIILDVGLNIKTYRDKAKLKSGTISNAAYKIGKGMNLGLALQFLSDDNYIRYLGFNAIAKRTQPDFRKAYNEIKKDCLLRSILYLVSSRNKEEFSSFMVINGQLISVLDIMNYAILNIDAIVDNPGQGLKFEVKEDKNSIQTEYRSINTLSEVLNNVDIHKRLSALNEAIYSMGITGYIKPLTILKSVGKI